MKWAEVALLCRHNACSVPATFVEVCGRWGPLQIVRCYNGTELVNNVTKTLFDVFGVQVLCAAVRHPQSQGVVERFNACKYCVLQFGILSLRELLKGSIALC